MNVTWQSKQVLKSGKHYQFPKSLNNQPKGVSFEAWKEEVKEFKLNKLIVLDKVPKTKIEDTTKPKR
jgi:hypothetical protein